MEIPGHTLAANGLSKRWALLCVTVLTVGAMGLRLYRLTQQSFNMDEGFSAYMGYTPAVDFARRLWGGELNMVLYYSLLRMWMHLGYGEFVIRLLSVLFAAATVPVAYCLGKRLFDRRTALIACLLLAVHPFHLMLAQRARSYSLVILLVSLSSLFFLRVLASSKWTNCGLWIVFSVAAVYSQFFAILVVFAQWLSMLLLPKAPLRWKPLLTSAMLMIALLAPLGFFLIHQKNAANLSWIPPLDKRQLRDVLSSLTLSKDRSLAYFAAWAVAIVCALRLRPREAAWPYWFTATWLFVPLVVMVLASLARPMLIARFLAMCIPAVVLLAAAGLTQLGRWSATALLSFLLLLLVLSISNIRSYYRHPDYGEEWREASAYLLAHAEPGDIVITLGGLPYFVFDYYRQTNPKKTPRLVVTTSGFTPLPSPAPQNVWFLASMRFNPEWKTEPGMFLQAHNQSYCPVPPQPQSTNVKVWQFRLCSKDE